MPATIVFSGGHTLDVREAPEVVVDRLSKAAQGATINTTMGGMIVNVAGCALVTPDDQPEQVCVWPAAVAYVRPPAAT